MGSIGTRTGEGADEQEEKRDFRSASARSRAAKADREIAEAQAVESPLRHHANTPKEPGVLSRLLSVFLRHARHDTGLEREPAADRIGRKSPTSGARQPEAAPPGIWPMPLDERHVAFASSLLRSKCHGPPTSRPSSAIRQSEIGGQTARPVHGGQHPVSISALSARSRNEFNPSSQLVELALSGGSGRGFGVWFGSMLLLSSL